MALYAWGENNCGQLGINSTIRASTPVLIPGNWKSIHSSGGSLTTVGIKCDGTMWVWGNNCLGQIGNNTNSPSSSPIQIPGTWIKAGVNTSSQTLALRTDCTLWTWGVIEFSGVGSSGSRSSPTQIPGTWTDVYIGYSSTTYGRCVDGTLWGWGRNTCGMLGMNNNLLGYYTPTLMPTNWKWAGSGFASSIFVGDDGLGRAAGFQQSGQLGNNQSAACNRSNPIMICGGHKWKTICIGGQAKTYAFREDGALFGWGNAPYYDFGTSPAGNVLTPRLIGMDYQDIHIYNTGIKCDGTIWGWGFRPACYFCPGLFSSPVLILGGNWEKFGHGSGQTIFVFGEPEQPPPPPPPPPPKINSRGSWTLWDVHERVIGNEWSNYDPTIDE